MDRRRRRCAHHFAISTIVHVASVVSGVVIAHTASRCRCRCRIWCGVGGREGHQAQMPSRRRSGGSLLMPLRRQRRRRHGFLVLSQWHHCCGGGGGCQWARQHETARPTGRGDTTQQVHESGWTRCQVNRLGRRISCWIYGAPDMSYMDLSL